MLTVRYFKFFRYSLLFFTITLCGAERGWNSLDHAKAYFHNSELQRSWAWRLLRQVPFTGSEKILDFGCGDGKITAELSCLAPHGHVIGVDLSASMIHLARIHFPKTHFENLEFKQTQSENFDDISGRFDVICAFSVFHFVAQPVKILLHLKEHLQPEGRLLLTIPSAPGLIMRQAADAVFARYHLDAPWHHPDHSSKVLMRSLEGCRQKLEEAGLEILMIQQVDAPLIYHDIDECTEWFVGSGSANWGIPIEISHNFFTDVIQNMIALDPSITKEDGSISLPGFNIQVIAKDRCSQSESLSR